LRRYGGIAHIGLVGCGRGGFDYRTALVGLFRTWPPVYGNRAKDPRDTLISRGGELLCDPSSRLHITAEQFHAVRRFEQKLILVRRRVSRRHEEWPRWISVEVVVTTLRVVDPRVQPNLPSEKPLVIEIRNKGRLRTGFFIRCGFKDRHLAQLSVQCEHRPGSG